MEEPLSLEAALRRCLALLDRAGESVWRARIEQAVGDGSPISPTVASEILSWNSGAGSFTDLVLHPLNGHALTSSEASAVNTELNRARSALYAAAKLG